MTAAPPDRTAAEQALSTVVDPELGIAITDLGLVRDIAIDQGHCRVTLTMTSASCPMGSLIVDDARHALQAAFGPEVECQVDLELEPPWTPDAMSDRARRLLGA